MIGGSSSSSRVGILVMMRRSTAPTWPCWMKALTRKRPMPWGLIAKLHSLDASNSRAWRSFMIERTMTALWSLVSACSAARWISPSILMAGGKPVVMKRSDPFLSTIFFRRP